MNENELTAQINALEIEEASMAGEPLQLFTIPRTSLYDLFHEFDKAMEVREIL